MSSEPAKPKDRPDKYVRGNHELTPLEVSENELRAFLIAEIFAIRNEFGRLFSGSCTGVLILRISAIRILKRAKSGPIDHHKMRKPPEGGCSLRYTCCGAGEPAEGNVYRRVS